jgi:LysR family hydrogen peroxide-inducible transcriptional activator
MDVRQLAALVAIADHGTFSAAARALFTVQSNVSGHVARLERELAVTLVDRQHGGLTEEGRIVVERARRVLREMDDIAADIASMGDAVAGEARIGFIGTTARWVLPRLLASLHDTHPGVHLIVSEANTTSLVPRVMNGELAAAVFHLPIDEPELEIEPLFAEDLIVLAHQDHELAGRDTISLTELSTYPLLLPPKGAPLRRVLDRAAGAANVTLRAQAEIDGVRLLASLAFEAFGAAIVPATAAPRWLQGDFHRVVVPELPRRVVAWVRRRRPAPGAPARAVLDVLREVLRTDAGDQPGVHVGIDAFPLARS